MTRKRRSSLSPAGIGDAFARGFVATALLAALQGRDAGAPFPWRKVVRHAVQGGAALAAGTAAAHAIGRRDYAIAAAATLAGGAVVMAAEAVCQTQSNNSVIEENGLGQEEG